MKQIKRAIVGLFIVVSMCILFTPTHVFAATEKYAVKVGNSLEGFKLCDKLIVLSPNNSVMVKAKAISSELGLSYKYNSSSKKITIASEYQSLVFTLNSKNYYHFYDNTSSRGFKETAKYQCYYDKKSKSYVIPIEVLDKLVFSEYYKLPKKDYYAKQGYKGIYYFQKSSGDIDKNIMMADYQLDKNIMMADNLADQIIAKVITDAMSDVEKVRALVDYMGQNFKYDHSYSYRTAYDILAEGTGICQAYALAYHLLVSKVGIKDYIVWGSADVWGRSDDEKHAWNMVKLGGNYYHVDTTWNSVGYLYFLLCDNEISIDHYWDKAIYPACNKGLQLNRESIEKMVGDYYYYCQKSANDDLKLFRIKYDGSDETLLLDIDSYYFENNYFYFAKQYDDTSFYRLDLRSNEQLEIITDLSLEQEQYSFQVYKEFIYVFYKNRILRINTETKEQQILYEFIENSAVYSYEIIALIRLDADGIWFNVARYIGMDCNLEKYQMNLDGTSLHSITS